MRLARARAGDHMAVEYDVRAAGAVARRVGERLEQVSPRVAVRHFDRFLRAGKDDRLQIPLHEVRHRRGGVRHRIGAVRDHEAVVFFVAVADDLRKVHPLPPAHVRAVEAVGLHGVDRAQRADFRHGAQKLLRSERGRQAVLALRRGDRAAGRDKQDFFHCGHSLIRAGTALGFAAESRK